MIKNTPQEVCMVRKKGSDDTIQILFYFLSHTYWQKVF